MEDLQVDIVPSNFQDLLTDEKRAFAALVTIMKDGSPQVTPIWFNTDGVHILINTAEGRVKDRNMRARAKVALLIQDPGNPYRYLQIRGRVIEVTKEGADAHIDALAGKYTGVPKYQRSSPGQVRETFKILPEHVVGMG